VGGRPGTVRVGVILLKSLVGLTGAFESPTPNWASSHTVGHWVNPYPVAALRGYFSRKTFRAARTASANASTSAVVL
jgi:hypothetical protein